MKLIFAVDAIFPPLTGIGRYAWELARRLSVSPTIDSLRLFSFGRWVVDPADLLTGDAHRDGTSRRLLPRLRLWAARQPLAVDLFSLTAPLWMAHRLRPYRDRLFHAPNYFLPPGTGPGIATIHDLSIFHYPETHPAARVRYFEREIAKTMRRARWLITDSEAVRQEVIAHFGWPADKVTAIPLGVDPAFRPRTPAELVPILNRYRLSPGAYALCVSTLEPRKNIGRLLAAYAALPAELRRRHPLVLAGGKGWRDETLHRQLDDAQREGWARHLGYVAQEHLAALYGGARAVCFPSLYEGFGLPVLEAMASGVPVLTSNRSSLPEVCAGAGYLVNPEDVDDIREGLRRVLSDESWRGSAIQAGLAWAATMTWDRCAEQTIGVYQTVARLSALE